jgi:lipid-binding SYLF domain-containing protein
MEKKDIMRLFLFCVGIITISMVIFVIPSKAEEPVDQQGLVDKARITFQSFMADENMAWFRDDLHKAKGLLIVPSLLKAGFVLGGSGGSGVLLVRNAETGQWSQPAFYTIGSVTFGFQIGGEAAEVIMMMRTQKAVDKLLTSSFKLGADISIATGPIGGGAKSNLMVDVISYTRSKGAYAGISLEGAVIATRDKWNKTYYGKTVTPSDILVKNSAGNPGSGELREALSNAFK